MIVTAQVEITYEVPDNLQRENLWKSGLVFIDNEFYKTITKKVIALDIMPEEKETVFQDAIDTFGEEYQIRKSIEELLELAGEYNKKIARLRERIKKRWDND